MYAGRNDLLNKELFKRLAFMTEKSDAEKEQLLLKEAHGLNSRCIDPLSEKEVQAIVKSCITASHRRPITKRDDTPTEDHQGCIIWASLKISKNQKEYISFKFKSMTTGNDFYAVYFKKIAINEFNSGEIKLYKFKVGTNQQTGKKSYILKEYH